MKQRGRTFLVNNLSAERIAGILVPVCIVLMEAFWVYPVLVWMGKWPALRWYRPPLGFLSVLALLTVSFTVTRLRIRKQTLSTGDRWLLVGLGLVVVFWVIRFEYGIRLGLLNGEWFSYMASVLPNLLTSLGAVIVALPAAAYLWFRGHILGRAHGYSYVYDNLLFAGGSYVLLVLLWGVTLGAKTFGVMATSIGPHIAGFYFFGLVALGLQNLRSVENRMKADEPQRLVYRRWLPLVLAVVGGLLILGAIIATVSSADLLSVVRAIGHGISVGWDKIHNVVNWVIYYILWPFQYLALGLSYVIMWLINLVRRKTPQQPGEAEAGPLPEVPKGEAPPESILTTLKWLLFIIAVILVTMIVARSLRGRRVRQRTEEKPDYEETHESLWTWRKFWMDIWRFLTGWMWWRRRTAVGALAGMASPGVTAAEAQTTLQIREVFRRLLREAARRGMGRENHETPYEYAERFSSQLPGVETLMAELTGMYVQVRYSTARVAQEQVARANSLWRQIREILRGPERI